MQTETPEMDRLVDRLFADPKRRVKNFNVWWGPEAHLLTAEERVGVLNRSLDDPGIEIIDIDAGLCADEGWPGDSGTQI